jgi:glycosyltransferase involved in cell wall biosynthesis
MKKKIIRISTVPISLDLLLKGQLKMLAEEWEVVAVSSPGKELERVAIREGVRTVAVPMERKISPIKDIISLFRLVKLFHKEKPTMVHSLTPKAGLLAMIAAWLCRVPVRIHTFTGLVFPTAKGIKQKILIATDRLTCRCATFINPEGEGVKRDLTKYHITEKPLNIIGNGNISGIDLETFSRSEKIMDAAEKIRKEGLTTFCFVGRIVSDKGINELVAAFEELHEKYPATRLLLVGTLEDSDPLKQETLVAINNNKAIEFAGWQTDIRPYLAASDIFVFPSYREGFPNVVLQAGAMGLPAIVTDINGSNEIIKEGVNGTIIEPRDKEQLKNAMERVLTDEKLRKKFASNARAIIASRYEQKKMWEALRAIYRSLIGE